MIIKKIKKKIKAILYLFEDAILAIRIKCVKPCLILFCDGGISSQMYQYMWGQSLIDKGYEVKYDLTFYEDDAKDMFGLFDRSYTLDKICYINQIKLAPRWQIKYYKRHYLNMLNQPPYSNLMSLDYKWETPKYLGNYYTCPSEEYLYYFKKYIHLKHPKEVLDEKNLQEYYEIKNNKSVGVHIRRGDMVKDTAQWVAPSVNYFINTMQSEEFFGSEFYIFSDEMDWVIEKILPRLNENIKYHLMLQNGSDKGYMDLYLLSACKHQIASQGSFGVVAFVLNKHTDKMLMLPLGSRGSLKERLRNQNVIYWTLEGERYE